MSNDIIALLKARENFRGMCDEALQEVVRHAQGGHHPAGSVVHEAIRLAQPPSASYSAGAPKQ
jgi:hypothetical protein